LKPHSKNVENLKQQDEIAQFYFNSIAQLIFAILSSNSLAKKDKRSDDRLFTKPPHRLPPHRSHERPDRAYKYPPNRKFRKNEL